MSKGGNHTAPFQQLAAVQAIEVAGVAVLGAGGLRCVPAFLDVYMGQGLAQVPIVQGAPAAGLGSGNIRAHGNGGFFLHGEGEGGIVPDAPAGNGEVLGQLGVAVLHINIGAGIFTYIAALAEQGEVIGAGLQGDALLHGEVHRTVGIIVQGIAAGLWVVRGSLRGSGDGVHTHVRQFKAGVSEQVGMMNGDEAGDGGVALRRTAHSVETGRLHIHGGHILHAPGHGDLHRLTQAVDGGNRFRQNQGIPYGEGQLGIGGGFNGDFRAGGAGLDILINLQRIQGVPVEVEQSLVVHGGAAVPDTGVFGIVFTGKGGGPAGAILLPQLPVFFHLGGVLVPGEPGNVADGDPGGFPIEHTHAGFAHVFHSLSHVGQKQGLSLGAEGIAAAVVASRTDGIGMAVAVFQGEGPGGFRHDDLLAVGVCHLLQHGGQIVQGAVPVGIPGGGENIVIHLIGIELLGEVGIVAGTLGIGEVDGNQDIPIVFSGNLPDGLGAGGEQLGTVGPVAFAADGVGGFVAHLNHAHIHTGVQQGLQALISIGFNGISLIVQGVVLPGLGHLLLAGVCPEVGVMEVDEDLHAGVGGPLAHGHGSLYIAVAAAVAVALGIEGIVPHTQTDPVGAAGSQEVKEALTIQFFAVKIIELRAAVQNGQNRGHVHAPHELAVGALDVRHINGCLHRIRILDNDAAGALNAQVVQIAPVFCRNGAGQGEGHFRFLGQRKGKGFVCPDIPSGGGDFAGLRKGLTASIGYPGCQPAGSRGTGDVKQDGVLAGG